MNPPQAALPYLLSAAFLAAQAPGERMDALLSRCFPKDQPGAVVRVQKEGKLLFTKAYGLASLEPGVALQEGQAFRIASVTIRSASKAWPPKVLTSSL